MAQAQTELEKRPEKVTKSPYELYSIIKRWRITPDEARRIESKDYPLLAARRVTEVTHQRMAQARGFSPGNLTLSLGTYPLDERGMSFNSAEQAYVEAVKQYAQIAGVKLPGTDQKVSITCLVQTAALYCSHREGKAHFTPMPGTVELFVQVDVHALSPDYERYQRFPRYGELISASASQPAPLRL